MERSREVKKLNGLPKRRQRSTGFRDSKEDGVAKKVRDREYELLNRNKRRKGDRVAQGRGRDEEESTEDSLYEEGSDAEQSNRRISKPNRVSTNAPPSTVTDEVIGVPVPRRSRSSRKMLFGSHHNSGVIYRFDDYVDEQNCWRPWAWAASRCRSTESPSSSSVSVRKKMRTTGAQTNGSSFSSSVNEDIEIEVAEVLYGLMKLSSGTREDDKGKSEDGHGLKDANDLSRETNQLIASPAVRPSENHSQPTVLDDHKSESLFSSAAKNEAEAEESANPVPSSSMASFEAENEQAMVKLGTSPQKADVVAISNFDSGAANHHLNQGSNEHLTTRLRDSKPSLQESDCEDGSATKNKSAASKEGSANLGSDPMDPTVTKAVSSLEKAESQREDKFKFDLMAPPPTVSSPERVDMLDLALQCNQKAEQREINTQISITNDGLVVKDRQLENSEGRIARVRVASLKLDSVKSHDNSGSGCKLEKLDSKEHLPKTILLKREKNGNGQVQSSPLPLRLALAGWSNTIPPLGLLPPFQMSPMDGGAASCRSLQSYTPFSQPRPKRSSTHGFIARNIHLHQQYVKMNYFLSAAACSAPTCLGKINDVTVLPPAVNLITRNSLQVDFPAVNPNNAEDKGEIKLNLAGQSCKDKGSDATNQMDSTQRQQFILQQGPRPASAGSLMQFQHPPAFLFPNSQTGASTAKAQLSNNATAGKSSRLLLGPTAASSSSYMSMGSSETPYLTILQNNGYPFAAISAPAGNPAATRGGAAGQVLPIFSGSVYSSQIFPHLQQQQQQQQHSQPLIQPAKHSISTLTGSSSTNKPPERQQQQGVQVGGNTCLNPVNMLSHQKSVYGQKAISQPIDFTVSAATVVGTNGAGNHSEKQQHSQMKSVKGGVDLIPSQAFAVSFGHNLPSNLSFSSIAHSPGIFHSLSGVPQAGYQVAPALQPTQQKNQMSDGKTVRATVDNGKRGSGKSHATGINTLVFDNAARTLNFVPSPATGNRLACSITPTSLPANLPTVSNSSNYSQQQHNLQHQSGGTTRTKAQTSSSLPASSIAAKFSSNTAAFPQGNCSGPTNWQNSNMPSSQVPHLASAMLNSKSHYQQQTRAQHGQTQISFGGNSKPTISVPVAVQQMPPMSSKTGLGGTTVQPQLGENCNGTGQKSSPSCGRNVPSILSTCPSQLSELEVLR